MIYFYFQLIFFAKKSLRIVQHNKMKIIKTEIEWRRKKFKANEHRIKINEPFFYGMLFIQENNIPHYLFYHKWNKNI